jgi:hypothetical protein
MGKKAKSSKGALRAKERKLDKSTLPPPPKPLVDEVRNLTIPVCRKCRSTATNAALLFAAISFSFA